MLPWYCRMKSRLFVVTGVLYIMPNRFTLLVVRGTRQRYDKTSPVTSRDGDLRDLCSMLPRYCTMKSILTGFYRRSIRNP